MTPTICDLLDIDVPLQCDGRPLTSFLEGATPIDWRTEVHHELDLRDPDSRLLEDAFGVTLEECALAVLRDDHGKYVQFSGNHAFPAIFFDIDHDPEQLNERRRRPRVRTQGARLRAAHARLAHASQRTHPHRHEAHPTRRPRRAPRPASPLTRARRTGVTNSGERTACDAGSRCGGAFDTLHPLFSRRSSTRCASA